MDQDKVKQLIYDRINNLPTLPDMIQKVLSLVQDEKTTANKLGDLISYDQAISSRLLKVANSAYYGFPREISTIRHAVVLIGFEQVKSLSLGIAVSDVMKGTNNTASLMQDAFWNHSVGCSLAATIICKKLGKPDGEVAFTASLLHDVGKIILANFFSKEYKVVLEKVQEDGKSFVEIEEEVFGFTHADVGEWLCSRWKLPRSLASSVRCHHKVKEVEPDNIHLTSVVHLADIVCRRAGIGNSGSEIIPPLQEAAREELCVDEEQIDQMIAELKEEEEKVKAFISSIK